MRFYKYILSAFLLLVVVFSANAGGNYLEDMITSQKYVFNNKSIRLQENACIDYKNLRINIPDFYSIVDTTAGKKINNRIQDLMVDQLNKVAFRYKLTNHAIEAEAAYLKSINDGKNTLVTCDINQSLYAPNINAVYYNFSQVFNHIVAFSVTYVYSTSVKNNKRMVDLRYVNTVYFDLVTGAEYQLSDLFNTSATANINSLIISKYKNKEYFIWGSEFTLTSNEYEYSNSDRYESYESEERPVARIYDDSYDTEAEVNYPEVEAIDHDYYDGYESESYYEDDMEETVEESYGYEEAEDYYGNEVVDEVSPSIYYDRPTKSSGSGRGGYGSDGSGSSEIISPNKNYYRNSSIIQKPQIMELQEFNYLKNGIAVFNALSFTYIIPAFQTCHNQQYGKCIAIRLTLDELKPFLNPKGPFGSLLKINKSSQANKYSDISLVQDIHTVYQNGSQFQKDVESFISIDGKTKMVKIKQKNPNFGQPTYQNRTKSIDSSEYAVIQEFLYENQKLVSHKTTNYRYNTESSNTEEYLYDSVSRLIKYNYYSGNRVNSSLVYHYDKFNNVVKKESFTYSTLNKIWAYSYYDNYIFEETFTPSSQIISINKYTKNKNNYIDSFISYNNNNTSKKVYRYDSLNNIIAFFELTNNQSFYNLGSCTYNKENQLSSRQQQNTIFELVYDSPGNHKKTIARNNGKLWFTKQYYFDKKNRVVSIDEDWSLNNSVPPTTYLIEYND